MNVCMNRIANIIIHYPKFVILCCALITLVMAFGITRLETRNNYKGNLPADDPIIQTNARFEEVFGNEQIMMVAIESQALFSPPSLKKIHQISEALSTIEGVPEDGVTSITTLMVSSLGDAFISLATFFNHDKGRETDLQNHLLKDPFTRHLISQDGTRTLILIHIARTASQQTVTRQIHNIIKKYEGPEKIYAIGDLIVAQEIDDGIEADLYILLPLALFLILTGFFAAFRNLWGMVLPFFVIVLSIIWTLGLMAFLHFQLNVVTSTIPILLVATASSYGIHMIHRYTHESLSEETAIRHLLQQLGPPVLLTGLTSTIGMLTLLLFQIASIREFGIFAAVGIFSAMLLAIVLLPAMLFLLKPAQRPPASASHKHTRSERLLLQLGTFSLKHRRFVIFTTLVLIVGSCVGIMRIRLGIDPVDLFPKQHPFQEASQIFNTEFSGWRYINLMVEDSKPNSVKTPAFLKSFQNFQEAVAQLPKVGGARSILDIFQQHPSHTTISIPDSLQDIENAFSRYAKEENTGHVWIDKDFRRAQITVLITTSDQEEQQTLYQNLQTLAQTHFPKENRVEFGGTVLLWMAGNHYVAIGKVYNIIAAILLVFVFCTLTFRSLRNGLLSIIPLTVAMLGTFGVMGFCNIRLNMATAIITSLGVGIGVDFAIHFLSRFQEERTKGHTVEEAIQHTLLTAGKAIGIDAASNISGFIVFAFSEFSPIQNLGWLVSLTMATCALATLILLPTLVASFHPSDLP